MFEVGATSVHFRRGACTLGISGPLEWIRRRLGAVWLSLSTRRGPLLSGGGALLGCVLRLHIQENGVWAEGWACVLQGRRNALTKNAHSLRAVADDQGRRVRIDLSG